MPFDINELLSNPAFAMGASVLGNSGQPGAIGAAYNTMNQINRLKQEAQSQQAQQQLGQASLAETSRYHTGQLESDKASRAIQQEQYNRQDQMTQAQLAKMDRQQRIQEAVMRALAPSLGVNLPSNIFDAPQQQQQQQQMPQQQPMQQPMQSPMQPTMQQQGGSGVPDASQIMQQMSLMQGGQRAPAQPMMNPSPLQQYGMDAMQQNVPKPPAASFDEGGQTYSEIGPDGMPRARLPGGAHIAPPQDNVAPQMQGQPFNPGDPRDPAGPNHNRGLGAPGIGQRPNLKTSAHGTPESILNGLRQVESGGNPEAINQKSGAMGPYQFMPGTVDQVRQQYNPHFDPFNPAQARDAADWLMSNYLNKNGGDLRGALGQYGGFKTQDASSYVHKVAAAGQNLPLQNVGFQQGDGGDQQQPQGGGNSGIDLARAGAMMGLAGLPGGQQLVQVGQMMEPKNVPAGSYQRDSAGKLTYVPDPIRSQELEMQARRLANENAELPGKLKKQEVDVATGMQNLQKGQSTLTNEQITRNKEYTADQDQLYKTHTWAQNMKENIDSMVQFDPKGNIKGMDPGFNQMTGASGAILRHIPGTPAYDMHQKLESLLDQAKFEVVNQMKNAAGQSGLGRVLQSEFQAMGESLAPIDPNMSTEQLAKSLYKIRQEADKLQSHAQNTFSQRYGALPGADQHDIPQATPGAVPTGVYAPPQGSAFKQQDVPKVTKVINGATYVKTGPSSWERQ